MPHTTPSSATLENDAPARSTETERWNLDASHSRVEFTVRHMGLSNVRGTFKGVTGHALLDTAGEPQAIHADVDIASIDTGDDNRDGHLRSGDFFDTDAHPTMTFRSTRIDRKAERRYDVHGDLTIRGTTKPVRLELETTAPMTDPWGNRRAAASLSGSINRKDWGLTWNQVLEMGALLVGEDVRITIDAQAVAAGEA